MKTISKYEAYAIKALRTMGVREDLAGFDYTVEAVLLVLLMAAVLALLMAAGVYKTLVGVLCMVVVAADMAFLVAGSAYLWREGWREK